MAHNKYSVECTKCGKKESFLDARDIKQAHWQIIAWKVETAVPVCICKECQRNTKVKE